MYRLFVVIYMLAGPALAGSAIVAALTMGRDSASDLIIAAIAGVLLAVPLTWFVTKKMAMLR